MDIQYAIQLAHEIIEKLPTAQVFYIEQKSKAKQFLKYRDKYIQIIKAINTEALRVTIYTPLTLSSNPIICVDDDGKCYRGHGEKLYFGMYAERLLNKEKTLFFANWADKNGEKTKTIDDLFTN